MPVCCHIFHIFLRNSAALFICLFEKLYPTTRHGQYVFATLLLAELIRIPYSPEPLQIRLSSVENFSIILTISCSHQSTQSAKLAKPSHPAPPLPLGPLHCRGNPRPQQPTSQSDAGAQYQLYVSSQVCLPLRSSKSRSQLRKRGDSFTIFRPTLLPTPNLILQTLQTLFPAAPFSRSTAAKLRSDCCSLT